jgi:putative heme iron utilization protein
MVAGVFMQPSSSRAQKARSLLGARRLGILTTVSGRLPGYPFASVTPFSLDGQGRPVFLMSGLAVHTKNVAADPRASLLVFEPGMEQDPLGSARMNLLGGMRAVADDELAGVRAAYLKDHPESAQWMGFGDFRLYRLEVTEVYYIGGFGEMGWISKDDFEGAR